MRDEQISSAGNTRITLADAVLFLMYFVGLTWQVMSRFLSVVQ